ncbi:hypothetical protein [Caldiplasma sukawensis]
MKGSPFRKRYILIYKHPKEERMRRDVFRIFGAKKKYDDGKYVIYLTDQFLKEGVLAFVRREYGPVTIYTSGTIKKCKKVIQERNASRSISVISGSFRSR